MQPLVIKPRSLTLLTALLLLTALPARAEVRKWTDAKGRFSVNAELVEVTDGKAVLKKEEGPQVAVPISALSDADREYLKSLGHPVDVPAKKADANAGGGPQADPQINKLLAGVLENANVPGVAGAIVTSDGLVAVGTAGVRKRGDKTPVTVDDLWHLGSDTKAMTATLVALLVEQGKLKWDTTLGDVFPAASFKIHPDLAGVTLLHLLSHRSGLPANLNLADYLGVDGRKEALRAVQQELAKAPATPPGSAFEYSNLGYIMAGAMIEKVTGKSWEQNMRQQVFGPLKMTSVGFGGTGTPGKLDQPWGHTDDGKPVSENGPAVDNPPVMGPAGRVHCTIGDWAKYVADFLRGRGGKPALLPAADYEKLATPPFGGDYALGWVVTERPWAGGKVLTHSGSNTMNYCTVWLAPQRDFAVLACTNQGGDTASAACDAIATVLIQRHLAGKGR